MRLLSPAGCLTPLMEVIDSTFAGHPHRTKITVMCVVLAFAWFNWPAVFYAFVSSV